VAHKEEVTRKIEEHLQKLTAEEWLPIFHANDIPAGPLNTVDKVVIDPQVQHLGLIVDVEHYLGGKVKLVGSPIMTDTPAHYFSPPTLGEHTDMILRDILHYSEEEIQKLKKEQRENLAVSEAHTRKKK
jgi:CoA:oxalate CoA-transferase